MKKFYLLRPGRISPGLTIIIIIAILVGAGIYFATKSWQPVSPGGESSIVEDILTRKEAIDDVSKKIAEISPVKAVLGGKWYVTRFWFVKDTNKDFYVEYEDGHILRQILIEAEKKDGELNYRIIAYFEPGETSWDLKTGEDKFFGSLLDLYEYSEELEGWIKKN